MCHANEIIMSKSKMNDYLTFSPMLTELAENSLLPTVLYLRLSDRNRIMRIVNVEATLETLSTSLWYEVENISIVTRSLFIDVSLNAAMNIRSNKSKKLNNSQRAHQEDHSNQF